MIFVAKFIAINLVLIVVMVFVIAHVSITWWLAFQRGSEARVKSRPTSRLPVLAHPSVSVLIPAWREAATIEACLHRLQQVQYPSWEIIVIAGGPDGTFEKVE